MKILYLNSTAFDSEMANLIQVKAMCKAMSEEGYNVTLSVPGSKPSELKNETYNIHFRNTLIKNKLDKYINIYSLIKSIETSDPDIVYIRDPLIMFYTFFLTRKKIIFESHSNTLHEGINLLDKFYFKVLSKGLSKNRIVKMVCISHALANFWESKGIPSSKISTAHDGIDLAVFSNKQTKEEARNLLGINKDKIVVTYAGRLYANRKIGNIILLASKFNYVEFIVVGGPNINAKQYEEDAKNLKLNNIFFTGQVEHDKVPSYLAASDILLALWSKDVRTINYCSPLKLFEYMASNRLTVAHAFPTIKEVLTNDVDAILVEPDNVEDLIIAIEKAIKTYDQSCLPANASRAVKNYTWQKRVQHIFNSL